MLLSQITVDLKYHFHLYLKPKTNKPISTLRGEYEFFFTIKHAQDFSELSATPIRDEATMAITIINNIGFYVISSVFQ